MSLPLPSFLRTRWLLFEARRALLEGDPERALERLADPRLPPCEAAEDLRARTLEALCRAAERLGGEGREDSAARLLARVAHDSPPLAEAWRRHLRVRAGPPSGGPRAEPRPASEARIAGAVGDLLARMRAGAAPPGAGGHRSAGSSLRFHLAIDEAGELLCVHGERQVIGHASGGDADLPLLGDLEPAHLALVRSESFYGGPTWRLEPLAGAVAVGGREPSGEGRELVDGDLVRLAPKVAFRFRRPEASSGSGLLELLHGLECEGATRVVLLAEGPGGRIRLGARPDRHVVVPGLVEDVELELDRGAGELVVRSRAQLEVRGWDARPGPSGLRLPCPPPARIDVRVGTPPAGRPPVGFALRSVGPPSSGGGRR